jgi:succinylglutamate desuccinylase
MRNYPHSHLPPRYHQVQEIGKLHDMFESHDIHNVSFFIGKPQALQEHRRWIQDYLQN